MTVVLLGDSIALVGANCMEDLDMGKTIRKATVCCYLVRLVGG